MCGIAGIFQPNARNSLVSTVRKMTASLRSRGPDHQGYWSDEDSHVALGHARLSILDLSAAADQPFLSASGKQAVVFNGEIYNHRAIAEELRSLGHELRTHSDTEVLLHAILEWGCENAVKKFRGMFAFAYFDGNSRTLWLGRDRMGEKPLYYGWNQNTFLFASELKAFWAIPDLYPEIDLAAVQDFLRYSCVPAPRSIYKGVHKLEPATLLRLDLKSEEEKLIQYWSLAEVAQGDHPVCSDEEHLAAIESELERAVAEQMVADVPVGAFLSGGIDSSLLVALMQKRSSMPVPTFTIGFHQSSFNEAGHAKKVAEYLGTDHTELYVSPAEAQDVIPRLPWIYDEPFADSSQIPTFLVAALARTRVKACVSGDGGDEVFAGYNRHFLGSTLWRKLRLLPHPLRIALAKIGTSIPASARASTLQALENSFPRLLPKHLPEKMDKLLQCLRHSDERSLYLSLVTQIQSPHEFMHEEFRMQNAPALTFDKMAGDLRAMQYLDGIFYLPNDILTKVDRATMAVGLESRAPYLDHRLVERAWALPDHLRVQHRTGKWALRTLLDKHVPRELVDRPKSGFAIPINDWLKGSLRDWAESLLCERALEEAGVLDVRAVRNLWSSYLEGRENSQYQVWNILMFQAWRLRTEDNAYAKDNSVGQHGLVSL